MNQYIYVCVIEDSVAIIMYLNRQNKIALEKKSLRDAMNK